jgi:hypothetical protein
MPKSNKNKSKGRSKSLTAKRKSKSKSKSNRSKSMSNYSYDDTTWDDDFSSFSSDSSSFKSKSKTFSVKKVSKKSRRKTPISFVRSKTANDKVTVVRITDEEEYKRYYPRNANKITPKFWELPNHKTFFNWVESNYAKYKSDNIKNKDNSGGVRHFRHQQLVRDFMQDKSPMRGILMYHGLGSGKTCASIAIAEASKSKKEVVFLSKAKLEGNFIADLKKCGHDYYRLKKHWVFCRCTTPQEKKLASDLGIPPHVIVHNKGIFLIDQYKKGHNLDKLGKLRQKLDYQIDAMIKKRYTFKHLDDTGY